MCHFVLVFFSPFSIAITSLGEERANLSAFRTFVRFVFVWICRWTFLLPFVLCINHRTRSKNGLPFFLALEKLFLLEVSSMEDENCPSSHLQPEMLRGMDTLGTLRHCFKEGNFCLLLFAFLHTN